MKPSERIKEKIKAELEKDGNPIDLNLFVKSIDEADMGISYILKGIMDFLDEEWEKNKPCEHEDSYQVDSTGEVYYNVCNDCGILFLAKPNDQI